VPSVASAAFFPPARLEGLPQPWLHPSRRLRAYPKICLSAAAHRCRERCSPASTEGSTFALRIGLGKIRRCSGSSICDASAGGLDRCRPDPLLAALLASANQRAASQTRIRLISPRPHLHYPAMASRHLHSAPSCPFLWLDANAERVDASLP
jgi:hypothetical protein